MLEAGGAGLASSGEGAAGGMGAFQDLEDAGRCGLHAEADAGIAGVGKLGEILRRGGLRVGFGGDLRPWRQSEGGADGIEDPGQPLPAQQGRRAAADEDGLGRAAYARGRQLQLAIQGIQVEPGEIPRATQLARSIGVEIAIATASGAEGNVNIQPEGFSHG